MFITGARTSAPTDGRAVRHNNDRSVMQRLLLSSGTEQQQKAEASGQRRHERAERWRTLCDNLHTRHERAERTEQHVCVRTWAERREDAATTSALANGLVRNGAGGRRLHRRVGATERYGRAQQMADVAE